MSATEARPAEWPAINRRVELAAERWAGWLPSRVELLEVPEVVVSAVSGAYGETIMPRPGERLIVRWPVERGVGELHASVVSTVRRPLPVWRLASHGRPALVQRRRFVRVPLVRPMAIRRDDAEHRATLLDLSEGGLACTTAPGVATPRVGEELEVRVALGERGGDETAVLVSRACVLRVTPGEAGAGDRVAVAFVGLAGWEGDRIRRFVFGELARSRTADWEGA